MEVRLEPLQTARDRHESQINECIRGLKDLRDEVKDLARDRDSHSLTVDQAVASVRSLLQRANRKLRDANMMEEEQPPLGQPAVDNPGPEVQRVRRQGNRLLL